MLTNLDQSILTFLVEKRSGFLTTIFSLFSFLGNWQFIVLAMVLLVVILIVKKKLSFIAPFILVVGGSGLVTFLGKIYFHRPRPLFSVFKETGFSFPSGHATVAVAFFGFLAFMMISLGWAKKKSLIYTSSALLIILIGFSRMYLGAHYLSDVVVGYVVGLVFLFVSVFLLMKKKYEII